MTDTSARERFGCRACWGESARDTWEALQGLTYESELVDESHFGVKIRQCAECAQNFVMVFTETVDWMDGEDPQHWTLLPITEAELARLSAMSACDERLLEQLIAECGLDRRSLVHDFPKGAEPRTEWSIGIVVGPHD